MSSFADSAAPATIDGQLVAKWGLQQPFDFLVEQGTPLRPFQLTARQQIKQNKRIILSLDKGLGKTLTVLSVFEDPEVHKNVPGFTVLILCPEKGIGSWLRDIQKFSDHADKFQVVLGTKGVRKNLWRNPKAKYFICTYDTFLSDAGIRAQSAETGVKTEIVTPPWVWDGSLDALVCDEFHRKFRRHNSKTFTLIAKWANAIGATYKKMKPIPYVVLMSGSAISKGPEDIWPALHILDPKFWSSYWQYVYTWCEVDTNGFGKTIIGPKANRVTQWRNATAPYIFHRTKAMIGDQLPTLNRLLMDVTLPPEQRRLHDSLIQEQFASWENEEGEEQFLFAQNVLAKLHKIRLALICPKALHEDLPYGQAIEDIYDTNVESEITRYLICTPFKAPIPHLAKYLLDKGARVWTLQGGIGLEEQERRLGAWRASLAYATPEHPSVLISTTKYAESWEAPEASYGYMLGAEWDPEDNRQAEARLHRLVSTDPVFWYYIRHLHAYDDEFFQGLSDKNNNRELTLSAVVRRLREIAGLSNT